MASTLDKAAKAEGSEREVLNSRLLTQLGMLRVVSQRMDMTLAEIASDGKTRDFEDLKAEFQKRSSKSLSQIDIELQIASAIAGIPGGLELPPTGLEALDISKEMRVMDKMMTGVERDVEEKLPTDPLQIFYKEFTKEIYRFAEEHGLPPEEVLTMYSGFTKEILRVAEETGLPPAKIAATYSGFEESVERIADKYNLPTEKVKQTFIGFVTEVQSVADISNMPPEVIQQNIVDYTSSQTRVADERGLSLKDLVLTYDGVTAGLDSISRDVQEYGLSSKDLVLAYSGETAAKDNIIKQIIEKNVPAKEAEVVYADMIDKFESKLVYDKIPLPEKLFLERENGYFGPWCFCKGSCATQNL